MEIMTYTRQLLQKNKVNIKLTKRESNNEQLPTIRRLIKFTGIVNQYGYMKDLFPVNNMYEDNSVHFKSVKLESNIMRLLKYYEKVRRNEV